MLKVLVVDDEPIVREGIKTIIQWETYGFTVCGDASNGLEGLNKIRELHPDLVIADIKMPVMDGLQMIEALHKENIQTKVIILTGYSYFEYAKKALAFGIQSYLLKPIEQDELIQEITKIYDQIICIRKEKDYIDKCVLLSREKVLENIAYGNDGLETIQQFEELYKFGFPWDTYQLVLLKHRDKDGRNKNEAAGVKKITKKHIEANFYGYVFEIERYLGILLKNINANENPTILKDLLWDLELHFGDNNLLTVGNLVNNFDGISTSLQYALDLMDKNFFFKDNKIIHEALVKKYINPQSELYIGNIISSLVNSMETHNERKIIEDIGNVKTKLMDYDIKQETLKAYYLSIYITIINNLSLKYENSEDIISSQKVVYRSIQHMTSIDDIERYVENELISLSRTLLEKKSVNVMTNVLAYIHKNLEKDLKLETLAKVFNYNNAYLGKIFKDYTGEYFNTYLDKMRMEKAKLLLKEGHKVYMVAEKVGYSNINYFYSKFKKYIGQSPSSIKNTLL